MSVNKGGRPPLWTDEESLEAAIDEYFDYCDNRVQQIYSKKADDVIEVINPAPYTMSGLAYFLHMNRDTLLEYGKKDKFSGAIKAARDRVAQDVENRLMEGGNAAGAIFNLKNNFGWKDKSEVDGVTKLVVETRKHTRAVTAASSEDDNGPDPDD